MEVKEKYIEDDRDQNKGIIIFLVIIILSLGGFLVYSQFFVESEEPEQNGPDEVENNNEEEIVEPSFSLYEMVGLFIAECSENDEDLPSQLILNDDNTFDLQTGNCGDGEMFLANSEMTGTFEIDGTLLLLTIETINEEEVSDISILEFEIIDVDNISYVVPDFFNFRRVLNIEE